MSNKDTIFYRKNKAVLLDFNESNMSSDSGILLAEKIERNSNLIKYFSEHIEDKRHESYVQHDVYNLLKQRVFFNMQGYEDANDVELLKNNAIVKSSLNQKLGSQPTISRFENSIDKHQIFNLYEAWVDRYVSNLKGRKKVVIDADGTDAETFGGQQYSLFNGFYGHKMYNELFFHDGETGEIILPVLRPGNAHSNWWFVSILKRIVKKIKAQYPDIEIIIRADSGFSTPKFYSLSEEYKLKFAIAIASNNVLKKKTKLLRNCVRYSLVNKDIRKQIITEGFDYQAGSWDKSEKCYAKIESTGKGLNVRYFISNIEGKTGREIYFDFYVKRGDRSENRIKEVKSMCFSDRMSNQNFWANAFRLIISSLSYEIFRLIKEKIQKTTFDKAKKWQINNIRLFLLKISGKIKETKRRIYVSLSNTYIYKELFRELITN